MQYKNDFFLMVHHFSCYVTISHFAFLLQTFFNILKATQDSELNFFAKDRGAKDLKKTFFMKKFLVAFLNTQSRITVRLGVY